MELSPIRLPAGVRDFLPEAARRRRGLAERLLGVFEAWGYARIITPAFECADVLERGLGADARAAAIRFVEPASGEVVALRPDITPQVARLIATRYREAGGPLRFCYEGAVTRLDGNPGSPGQREILQAGIELVDASIDAGDAEVVAVAMAALASARLDDARLDLGHVAPARYVLDQVGHHDAPAAARLRAGLARKDRASVEREASRLGGPPDLATLARALVGLWGTAREVLPRAAVLPWPDSVRAALEHLASTIAVAHDLVGTDDRIPVTIDLGWVRGFDYYTGLRLAGYARGAADAILRGGRYDDLIGRYGRSAPAVGFAIDVEALAEAGATPARTHAASVIVIDGDRGRAAAVARALRVAGVRVALEPVSAAPAAGLARYLGGIGADLALVMRPNGAVVAITGDGVERATEGRAYHAAAAGDGAALGAWITAARQPRP